MALAPTTVGGATLATPAVGALFEGLKFFLTQRTPMRGTYVERVERNGGRVVRLETQADYIIADHVRHDSPPGSLSYRFIDQAIREGALPDPKEHPAGPTAGSIRDVGSVVPGRTTRTPFTAQDDRDLRDWVAKMSAMGGSVKGNEIYKQLERENPRHSFQAWRDRYIKKLMITGKNLAFTQNDFDILLNEVPEILGIHESQVESAWSAWAQAHPSHTAKEWQTFCHQQVLPAYWNTPEAQRQAKRKAETLSAPEETSKLEVKSDRGLQDSGQDVSPVNVKRRKVDDVQEVPELSRFKLQKNSSYESDDQPPRSTQVVDLLDESEDDTTENDKAPLIASVPVSSNLALRMETREDRISLERGNHESPRSHREQAAEYPISSTTFDRRRVPASEDPGMAKVVGDANNVAQVQLKSSVESNDGKSDELEAGDEIHGVALTKENLASQQAQHTAVMLRGTDLPEDDELQDRRHYIQYLQSAIGQAAGQSSPSAQLKSEQLHGSSQMLHGNVDLPLSSQAEIEESLEDSLQWPNSPIMPKLKNASASYGKMLEGPPGTDVSRPSPTATQRHRPLAFEETMNDVEHLSQEHKSPPALCGNSVPLPLGNSSQAPSADDMPATLEREVDEETSLAYVSPSSRRSFGDVGEDEDENIDLTIPEPDGGFNTSSQGPREQSPIASALDFEDPSVFVEASSIHSSSLNDDERNAERRGKISRTLDTQAILDAETQQPDFDIALPPDSDDDDLALPTSLARQKTAYFRDETYLSSQDFEDDLPSDPLALPMDLSPRTHRGKLANKPTFETQPETLDSQPLTGESFIDFMDSLVAQGHTEEAVEQALHSSCMRGELAEFILLEQKRGNGFPTDVAGVWSVEEDAMLESGNARGLRRLEEKHTWAECERRLNFLSMWREEE